MGSPMEGWLVASEYRAPEGLASSVGSRQKMNLIPSNARDLLVESPNPAA
jgi:hypothetical protein